MKNLKKIFLVTLLILSLFGMSGRVAFADPAEGGLVKCGKEPANYSSMTVEQKAAEAKKEATQCNFAYLISLINILINYAIYLAMSLSAIAFAYAGWLYMTAGGNSSQVGKARKVFATVGIGLVVLLSGWLVFKLIADTFLSDYYGTYLN